MASSTTPDGHPASSNPDVVPLPLTGERTLPGIPDERYWFTRHVVAYLTAADDLHGGEVVLDAGCGEGYGLAILANAGASRVVGVDLDPHVVAHADATYADEDRRIEVERAELSTLPLDDDAIDLTVSFQVIEHLWDVPAYLASLVRVTRPGGRVWIATPNRLTFTPDSDAPVNPFHVREFTASELEAVLTSAGLVVERILGVHHGPRLQDENARLGRPFLDAIVEVTPDAWDDDLRNAVYATTVDDFEVRTDDLDASLDLIAVARVPEPR
jgi:SAM-dependent methyltransferase